jgi:hypothetical protein
MTEFEYQLWKYLQKESSPVESSSGPIACNEKKSSTPPNLNSSVNLLGSKTNTCVDPNESGGVLQKNDSSKYTVEFTSNDDFVSQFLNEDYISELHRPILGFENDIEYLESASAEQTVGGFMADATIRNKESAPRDRNIVSVEKSNSPIGNSENHAGTNDSNTTVCFEEYEPDFRLEQPNTTVCSEEADPDFRLEQPNTTVCIEEADPDFRQEQPNTTVCCKEADPANRVFEMSQKRNCKLECKNIVGKLAECLSVIQSIMNKYQCEKEMDNVSHSQNRSFSLAENDTFEFLKKQKIEIREANRQLQNTQNMLIRDMHHIRTERIRLEEDKRNFLKYKRANESMNRIVSQAYVHENKIVFKMKHRIYSGDIFGKELLDQLEGNMLITANNIDNIFFNLLPHITSVSVRCCMNGKLYSLDYFDSIDFTQIYVTIQGFDYSTKVIESAHIVLDLKG